MRSALPEVRHGARAALSALAVASALSGCAHSAASATDAGELRELRGEVRRLEAERERDRRTIRALEAQIRAMGSKAKPPRVDPSPRAEAQVSAESEEPHELLVLPAAGKSAAADARTAWGDVEVSQVERHGAEGSHRALLPPDLAVLRLGPNQVRAPSYQGDEAFHRGMAALEEGDPALAIRHLEAFVEAHPQHPEVQRGLIALGEAWIGAGKPGNALRSFERVIREFPGGEWTPEALLRYGEICMNMGRVPAARAAFRKLVEDHPTSAAAGRAHAHLATR